ncbi:MAG: ATP-dependent Clp protease ATP-binding subunit [Ruminococcaceae bacterium]|nr:ATP-dependent Clp protease ATP-binding subunit [Oscillospiraceae bacterium]
MTSRFTKKAQNSLNKALFYAREMGHDYIGTEHLLLGLLTETDSIAYKALTASGVTLEQTRAMIEKAAGTGAPSAVNAGDMTPRTKTVIESSAQRSVSLGHSYIGTEHLLLAILGEGECFAMQLIRAQGGSAAELENTVMNCLGGVSDASAGNGKSAKKENISGSPTLSSYGRDLCALAKEGKIDPIIGRDEETERVIQILSRRTKNNPCLIGEPGVGKTAVVEGLAQRIVEGNVPETLRGKQIVTLDISSMIAGAKYRGEFEERMKGVMTEVRQNPSIILFIDEIHTIIGAGGAEGAVDAANIIKPALARGEMHLIGATTIDEYRRHIEKDAALERRFQSVMVGEPTPEEAVEILRGLRDKYEAHHKLKITDGAIEAAVKLSVRYIGDRYLPDKAIDLIDEAASRIRIKSVTVSPEVRQLEEDLKKVSAEKEEAILGEDFEAAASLRDKEKKLRDELSEIKETATASAGDDLIVGENEICEIVTSWTGIPVKKLGEEEGERLLHLDSILKDRIIGQDAAVDAVARAIRRGRVGLKDPMRPIGSFIFLGPTGVGKTELTKALADVMFGDENAMIRVDMSEYMEKHSTSKLIGSPPGYVGYDDGGQLTEKIRRHPYSVVLFDEIEKAHPDVFNILLQILEDGILTDSHGRRVDFKNTVIIMTSNVGASGITQTKRLGFSENSGKSDEDSMRSSVMDALKNTFRPEFLNRIDEIIIFNKLGDEDIRKIAGLMLDETRKRIGENGINITFGEDVAELLAKEGFDPVYGARPLRRAIIRRVEDSLSEAMLSGTINKGDTVEAFVDDGKIEYKVV